MRHFTLPRRATIVLLAVLMTVGLAAPGVASSFREQRFGPAIEGYSRYQPQTECVHKEQPGVAAFRDMVLAEYPGRDGGIVRACSAPGRSEHKEGRAWDWMVHVRKADERDAATEVIGWLLATDEHGNLHANARRLGVMYIIWNRRIWSASRADEGWRTYTGPDPHIDHVHISFNRPGARAETSFWQPIEAAQHARLPGTVPESLIRRQVPLPDALSWILERRHAGR